MFAKRVPWSLLVVSGLLVGCAGAPVPEPSGDSRDDTAVVVEVGDIAAENAQRGSRGWLKGKRQATDVAATGAYADESSVYSGDSVGLYVSTADESWKAIVYRMGSYGGKGGRLVWKSDKQPGIEQTKVGFVEKTRTHYAEWKKSLALATDGWQPGMYLIRVSGSSGHDWLVPLVVRSPDVDDRLVLVMSDLTWQAYNEWGGRSTYLGPNDRPDRSRAVSFSRPYENGNGTGKYLAHEDPVVKLVEGQGFPVSYLAASDLDSDSDALDGAAGVVFLGHDEYWTTTERTHVTAARDSGVDLAFLGANTMYWRARLSPDGPGGLPLETIYKSADEDPVTGPDTTARFRDRPDANSERALVGQQYECYPAVGTYTVAEPGFFAFADTGIGTGETVPAILDVEVDRAYPGAPTPANLQIVAASPTSCSGNSTVSTTTYYSHESGAGVFSTGTMGWVLRGLGGQGPEEATAFTERVTLNVLHAMLAGQMGEQHPSVPNLSNFDLPAVNTTGAA